MNKISKCYRLKLSTLKKIEEIKQTTTKETGEVLTDTDIIENAIRFTYLCMKSASFADNPNEQMNLKDVFF